MKSIGRCLGKDWKELLADCFPKIMVNILPYFALGGQEALVAQQREKAHRVYDLLTDSSYLGKQVRRTMLLLRRAETGEHLGLLPPHHLVWCEIPPP